MDLYTIVLPILHKFYFVCYIFIENIYNGGTKMDELYKKLLDDEILRKYN